MPTKKEVANFPDLDQFLLGYFGQNYSYYGSTIKDIVQAYEQDCSSLQLQATISDILRFVQLHGNDLDDAFDATYGNSVDPKLWGHTTESFMCELSRLLHAPTRESR